MRVITHKLDDGTHAAFLVVNGPDPTMNVRWRSAYNYPTRGEAYRVAVTVARVDFGVSPDELAN